MPRCVVNIHGSSQHVHVEHVKLTPHPCHFPLHGCRWLAPLIDEARQHVAGRGGAEPPLDANGAIGPIVES
jgi:hypothetical protein